MKKRPILFNTPMLKAITELDNLQAENKQLSAERDKLREALRNECDNIQKEMFENDKLIAKNVELQETNLLLAVDLDKALDRNEEIVNWLSELIPFGEEQYPDDQEGGLFGTAKSLYKKLTGQKWEEVNHE